MTATRLITLYTLQISLNWALYAVMFPIQILYMTARGMSMLDIGLLVAIFSMTTFLLEVPTGTLADQLGRKKMYLASLAVQAMAMGVLLLARDFWGIALGNMLLGVARALASGTLDAWFVETLRSTDPHYPLEQAMAWVNGGMTLVLGGVTLAAGFVPALAWPQVVSGSLYSLYDANVLVTLLLIPVVWGYTVWCIHEPVAPRPNASLMVAVHRFPTMLADVVRLASRPALGLLLTTTAFAGFAYFAIENFWQPTLQTLMTDPMKQSGWLGLTGALFFLANALGNLASPVLSRLLARKYTLMMGLVFLGVGLIMLVVGWQTHISSFVLLFCGHTFFWGLGEPVYERLFHDEVPDALRSSLTSSQSLLMQLGGVTGGLCLGALADWQGLPPAWSFGGVVFACSASLFWRLRRIQRHIQV